MRYCRIHGANVLHRLRYVADAAIDRTAVASVDGELTYEEFYDRVDRDDAALGRLGIEPGDRFGLVMGNSIRTLCTLFAGWQRGAVPTPVNTRLDDATAAALLGTAGAGTVVLDGDSADRREAFADAGHELVRSASDADEFDSYVPGEATTEVEPRLDGDDALFLHTGGTTGRPRWVRITHGNLAAQLGQGLDGTDRSLHYYPLYHSGGIDVTPCRLLCGGTVVIGRGWDPGEAPATIERHAVDGITVVPQMGYELVHHDLDDYDLSSPEYFIVGSDTVTEELAATFRELGAQPMQAYGPTETMAVIAVTEFGDTDCPLDSTGEVIEGVARVRIVDPETGDPVERGAAGEILVRGDKVTPGYHDRPDAEAETFESGWLHTDDLGRVDDEGYLYITGRLDNLLIVGGENVYPTDVEETLAAHPAVAQAVVVGRPDERRGEIPVANVVLEDGEDLSKAELTEWFIERDAAFKHPREVRFAGSLPKTPVGKIDRSTLSERVRDGD
nr:AMP-binding protein [Halobellus ruber]